LRNKPRRQISRIRCLLYRLNTPCTETWEIMRLH
jgi:hypothetical protein